MRLVSVMVLLIFLACLTSSYCEGDEGFSVRCRGISGSGAPDGNQWKSAPVKALILKETPRVYSTDPPPSSASPPAYLQILKCGDATYIQVIWKDATPDRSIPKNNKTAKSDHFSDACAIMWPASLEGPPFPSLMMGDEQHKVKILYWSADRGGEEMEASGRATTGTDSKPVSIKGEYKTGEWKVIFKAPQLPEGTGIAVAIWDGKKKQRDGRKYFSPWYRISGL